MKSILYIVALTILLAACSAETSGNLQPTSVNTDPVVDGQTTRHNAPIPPGYAGLKDPIPGDQESIDRGAAIYAVNCASCHGERGLGDGPAGAALDPAPAAIAETSKMLGDDYLFWRISEGSDLFNTAMPAWKVTLDEQSRWDLIHYMRTLGN